MHVRVGEWDDFVAVPMFSIGYVCGGVLARKWGAYVKVAMLPVNVNFVSAHVRVWKRKDYLTVSVLIYVLVGNSVGD